MNYKKVVGDMTLVVKTNGYPWRTWDIKGVMVAVVAHYQDSYM